MNKKLVYYILIFFVVMFIGGAITGYMSKKHEIAVGESNPQSPVAENPEGEADPSRMNLGMKKWYWIKTLRSDGKEVLPTKQNVFALSFGTDGNVGIFTDCNSMGAHYTATGSAITFTEMMGTQMYCEGTQEVEFSNDLNTTGSYLFTSKGELILKMKTSSGTMIFR